VVDVWRVDLNRATDDGGTELLCVQERERAARIVDARRRALWVRSRGVLRALLGGYLDTDPRELRFESGPHGKPWLHDRTEEVAEPEREQDLRFNLSHSGELMLVVVTDGREVGVDIELARERHSTGERLTAEFLRAWTVREATVKCLGAGLRAAPAMGECAPEGMWTAELDVGPGAFAAVAIAGLKECELHRLDWPVDRS
jgi:4'-phosphopantetheinyl transferase